ncbi:MAG: sigma-70 family RNA polymerase sigma factor [Saprospiraceae bacterium]|nr:sigma-70 family RNA polymerase sigma factor [Saprospiraceae bacterium]
MSEQDLIRGCLRENQQCQAEVFQRYAGKMLTVCLRYARHRMEAEDMLQDAFIKVFDNINQFQFVGSFEGWVRRIVVNTALKKFQQKSFKDEAIGIDEGYDIILEPSVYADLHEEELLNLIAQLPDGYRVVFNLYAIEGYSHSEIAEMLGIEESTSRTQLLKARRILQDRIVKMQKIAV